MPHREHPSRLGARLLLTCINAHRNPRRRHHSDQQFVGGRRWELGTTPLVPETPSCREQGGGSSSAAPGLRSASDPEASWLAFSVPLAQHRHGTGGQGGGGCCGPGRVLHPRGGPRE